MTVNQFIKPITVERRGNLFIGGCDMVELAKKYGTPLYVIDEASLRKICREYKEAFFEYPNIRMTYASKALCNMTISKIVEDEGFGFDVVSAGEIFTLKKAGVDLSRVTFNGNNKTESELIFALENNVGRFSVDNRLELYMLNRLAEAKGKKASIHLRITPGIECHTHEYIQTGQIDSKFGFDMNELEDIIHLIKNEYKSLNLKGLHAHIGSQIFELQSFKDEIDVLIKVLTELNSLFGLKMNELNIGGGLGVKYTETDNPPSVSEFASTVISELEVSAKKYNTELPSIYIEPGRSIISTAGITLYTVGSSKNIPNVRKYIAVDGGMADNPRPSMYQAKYTVEIANDVTGRKTEVVTVAGRYCESGDIVVENANLHEPQAGDILCVYNTGSYNYSMASNYNRVEKPAMVLVNNSQSDIIVNRESLEDLVSHEKIPDRLRK